MDKKYSVIEVLWLILIAVLITVGVISSLSVISSGVSHVNAMSEILFTLRNLTSSISGVLPYLSAILWSVVCLSHIYEFYIKWKSSELTTKRFILYSVFTGVIGILLHWFCVTTSISGEHLS